MQQSRPPVYSISELNAAVKAQLEGNFRQVWLSGEISNFTQPVSGHWYFSLKDNAAQVRGAMFRGYNSRTPFRPQNGMQVIVCAKVSLYEPRGDYQIIVEQMLPAGDGMLQQQFEALKLKLAERGWFDAHLKKSLPQNCQRVGIVTSSTGAALHDILKVLRRRDPSLEVVIYPSLVQGKEAAANIAAMIDLANRRQEVDVLIVGRGGGSLEDLWCFNEEIVAEAIYRSQLPIISAVGHEVDVTIADFVADVRAATPSVAAELVSRDRQALLDRLQNATQHLGMALDRCFGVKTYQLHQLKMRLLQCHPQKQLADRQQRFQAFNYALQTAIQKYIAKQQTQMQSLQQRLQHNPLPLKIQKDQQYCLALTQRLQQQVQGQFQQQKYHFSKLCAELNQLSPLAILGRGYSITLNSKEHVIKNANDVQKDEIIRTHLAKGIIISRVEEIKTA